MPLDSRPNVRTSPLKHGVFLLALLFAATNMAHANPIREAESGSLDIMNAIANGVGNKTVADVMEAYDSLLVTEKRVHDSISSQHFSDDPETQQKQVVFYHKRAIERGMVSNSFGGDKNGKCCGVATLKSASLEDVMPYAHIVLPYNDLIAYEVIDISTFGADKLSGDQVGKIYEQITAKQHINEGPEKENGRRAGRDVVVITIDSKLNDSDSARKLGDARILSIQTYAKPEAGSTEWTKSFIKANVETPTKQEHVFGHACGIAQASIAVCMSLVMNHLGIDKDGSVDVFPAVLSYGFGTVVGIYSRTYRNFTQWGNDRDRLFKTSIIGYLFAYTLTIHNGIDSLIYKTLANPSMESLSQYGDLLMNNMGSLVGLAGIATALLTHTHLIINNKLSNWAKVNFHTFNQTRDRAGYSTKPLMIPENVARRSFAFVFLMLESISASIVKPFVPKAQHEAWRQLGRSVNGKIIRKLPKSKAVVTSLEQGAVEYQGVYIGGHYPFKMFDLIPSNTRFVIADGLYLNLSKILLFAVTPAVKYLNLIYSRTVLRSLEVSASPHVEEFKKHHYKVEENWNKFLTACLPHNILKNLVVGSFNTVKGVFELGILTSKIIVKHSPTAARIAMESYISTSLSVDRKTENFKKNATSKCLKFIRFITNAHHLPPL